MDEIEPLINAIRSDGWRSYQTVSKKLGIVHNRAVLRDPKDSIKLLPWTHKIIANAKAVFAGPHMRIPLIPATHSGGFRPGIPIHPGHLFRSMPATLVGAKRRWGFKISY